MLSIYQTMLSLSIFPSLALSLSFPLLISFSFPLSLFPSFTHTHTHTLSLSVSLSIYISIHLSISLSLDCTITAPLIIGRERRERRRERVVIRNVRKRKGQESLLLTHFILVLLQDARTAHDVNISLISHIELNLSYLSSSSSLPPPLDPLSHPHIHFLSVPPHWHILWLFNWCHGGCNNQHFSLSLCPSISFSF